MRPIRLLQVATFVSTLDRFAMPPAYGLMRPVWGLVSQRIGPVRTMRLAPLPAAVEAAGSPAAPDGGRTRPDADARS